MKRLAAIALAALAVGGCGRSEATAARDSRGPASPSTWESGVAEPAEGPGHRVGTLGDQCERGTSERIEPPDAGWAVSVLDTVVSPSGNGRSTLDQAIRIRYPRDWVADHTTAFGVSHRDGHQLAEVYLNHLTHLGLARTSGAPWDERIQALEESNDLKAERASRLPGGRCLVRGRALLGPFAATLSPLGPDQTVVAIAGFPDAFDIDRSLDEIPGSSLTIAMRIMNSLEIVEDVSQTTT